MTGPHRMHGKPCNRRCSTRRAPRSSSASPRVWILAEARADRIPHVRLGRYVRFDADELAEWCRSQHRGPRQSASAGPDGGYDERTNKVAPRG